MKREKYMFNVYIGIRWDARCLGCTLFVIFILEAFISHKSCSIFFSSVNHLVLNLFEFSSLKLMSLNSRIFNWTNKCFWHFFFMEKPSNWQTTFVIWIENYFLCFNSLFFFLIQPIQKDEKVPETLYYLPYKNKTKDKKKVFYRKNSIYINNCMRNRKKKKVFCPEIIEGNAKCLVLIDSIG